MKNRQKLYLVHLSINKLKSLKVAESKEDEKDGEFVNFSSYFGGRLFTNIAKSMQRMNNSHEENND